jgi:DNA-binding HxlR family transcriptional regulator
VKAARDAVDFKMRLLDQAQKYARGMPTPAGCGIALFAVASLPSLSDLHNDSDGPILGAMQRKNFGNMQCPIARSLERVGEWWSILILRDAVYGLKRFDEFQKSLEIAPNMLTRRLNALVKGGLLKRQRYSEKPPRYEYVLTDRGRDFRPVLLSLLAWGNKHFAPEGTSVLLADTETGAIAEPVLVDRVTGRAIPGPGFSVVPGPAAGERVRQRLARAAEMAGSHKPGVLYE